MISEALRSNRPSEIDLVGAGERAGADAAECGGYAADSDQPIYDLPPSCEFSE